MTLPWNAMGFQKNENTQVCCTTTIVGQTPELRHHHHHPHPSKASFLGEFLEDFQKIGGKNIY
jgi:hypothetical protein